MAFGLFRSFASRDKPAPRAPAHVGELARGDVINFGLTAPAGLAGAALTVAEVLSFNYDQPIGPRRVVQFAYDAHPLRAWRGEDGRPALARELLLPEVESTFRIADIKALFTSDQHTPARVRRRKKAPEGFLPWTADDYRREAMHKAVRHDGDVPVPFDFYRLVATARDHALELEVHAGGRTRAWAILYPAPTMIDSLWAPSGDQEHA